MDASNPEVRQELERSLKSLAWIRNETKQRLDEVNGLLKEADVEFQSGKIAPDLYSRKRQGLETSRETVLDTLRINQRHRTLVISWLQEADRT